MVKIKMLKDLFFLQNLSTELDLFPESRTQKVCSDLINLDLYPPLPYQNNILIWGHHLIREALLLKKSQLSCQEFNCPDPIEMLALALKLENRTGFYTYYERENIFLYLQRKNLLSEIGRLIKLIEKDEQAEWVSKISIFSSLCLPLKKLVAEGLLDLKLAQRIYKLPEEVFQLCLMAKTKYSFTERRKFLLYLWEISQRDRLSAQEVIELTRQAFSLKNGLSFMEEMRYPNLSNLNKKFLAITQALRKKGISISPPPNFEGEGISISFSFTSAQVFKRKIETLKEFEANLEKLFELL